MEQNDRLSVAEHERADRIKNQIITIILNSPLNIPFIPDDLERELYMTILSELEPIVTDRTMYQRACDFICKCFRCGCLEYSDNVVHPNNSC